MRTMRLLAVVLSLALITPSLFAGHADKPQTIVARYDTPMATTYFEPEGIPTVKQQIKFKIYPYIGHKTDKTWFRLVIGLPFLPNENPEMYQAVLTVDGGNSYTLDYQSATVKRGGVFMSLFDIGGDDVENIVRKVASGKDVWLVVLTPPNNSQNESYVRTNLHLTSAQVDTFRMIVEKADALKMTQN